VKTLKTKATKALAHVMKIPSNMVVDPNTGEDIYIGKSLRENLKIQREFKKFLAEY
jgi:hypothetical protein